MNFLQDIATSPCIPAQLTVLVQLQLWQPSFPLAFCQEQECFPQGLAVPVQTGLEPTAQQVDWVPAEFDFVDPYVFLCLTKSIIAPALMFLCALGL
jgi:hypothetical protein